jgi:hypothetical protein
MGELVQTSTDRELPERGVPLRLAAFVSLLHEFSGRTLLGRELSGQSRALRQKAPDVLLSLWLLLWSPPR